MFKGVTLEMSLKPFKSTDEEYMRAVVERIFEQWKILIGDAEEVSVLLWTSDGSEILDWHGDLDEEMEWGRYVGGANSIHDEWHEKYDPEGIGLHSRAYFYMDNPPQITFGTLKKIVSLIKEIGKKHYPDKRIRVGETFDPGPEFAVSKFKYVRHNEICHGTTMGANSFVCCYSTLHADDVKYAAYPNGIKEGTALATFFGKQSQSFLSAMGFDYLWLSNGFGFGLDTWSTTGAIFDGKNFDSSHFDEVKEKILEFWRLFRAECNYRVETRGTNLTTGIDLATDGVPLKSIYEGDFDLLPPPNSPWAALDGNFGLELSGYMSRICKLPSNEYLFRYYVHDPWWANSPWHDRYESLPHDIYLPMAVCRLDDNANVQLPTHINILSIDNSFGEMPDFCAQEPSIHINKALRHAPDAPSSVIWIYPFDEYHQYRSEDKIKEMFFGDWFICGAINHGFPLSSVISTDSFIKSLCTNPHAYDGRILVSIVPATGSAYEKEILACVKKGIRVIFYGNAENASADFLSAAGIRIVNDALFGEMDISVSNETDEFCHGRLAKAIMHRDITCGGGLNAILADNTDAKPFVTIGGRIAGTHNGNMVWLDGTCSANYEGGKLLTPDDEEKYYSGDSLMRKALDLLGTKIRFRKEYANSYEPVIMLSRHENAHMISVCAKDTTVTTKMRFPLGVPVPCARETKITSDGFGEYHFSKAEFLECRFFVEQGESVISCHDMHPVSFFRVRRIKVSGLKNATIRFFAPEYCKNNIEAVLNSDDDFALVSDPFDGEYITDENGTYFEARNVTGDMIFSIPFKKLHGSLKKVEGNIPPINQN